jgi:hypothetical protein
LYRKYRPSKFKEVIGQEVEVPVTESEVMDVVANVEVPETVRLVIVVVASVEVPVTLKVPPTARRDPGVVDPIPTFPLASTVKSVLPVEEATVNGLSDPVPCTKKVEVLLVVVPTPILDSPVLA